MALHRISAKFAAGTYGADDWRKRVVLRFGGGGGQTSTIEKSDPWSGVQPDLNQAYSAASNLFSNYTPQYYPGSTYFAPTAAQNSAISGTINQATQGEPVTGAASNFDTNLLNGDYLNNPGSFFAMPNASGAAIRNNPSNGLFGGVSSLGFDAATNPSSVPGSDTLTKYANGSMLAAGNPNQKRLTDSIAASVIPQVEAPFIQGGAISNPAMAYAASQGVTSALAPSLFQDYETQAGNQLSASQALGSNFFGGINAANTGATGLSGNFLGGSQIANTAANSIGTNFNSGVTAMGTGLAMAPQTQTMPYLDLQNLWQAGQEQQTLGQNALNADVQRWNYNQQLPYNTLDQFLGQINGSPGGQTSMSQPYFSNDLASGLGLAFGGVSSAALLYSALAGSGAAAAGSGAAAGSAALAGLAAAA